MELTISSNKKKEASKQSLPSLQTRRRTVEASNKHVVIAATVARACINVIMISEGEYTNQDHIE